MKVLLICEASWTVISFRKELIMFLKSKGNDVSVLVGDNERIEEISTFVDAKVIPFKNRNINPFALNRLIRILKIEIENINPDIILTFSIKANIAGCLAARKHKCKIFPMVEGLGDVFQPTSFKQKTLRNICAFLYKKALKHSTKVFFLNNDDVDYFVSNKIASANKCIKIDGIGIDASSFEYSLPKSDSFEVLMMARLIKSKGIFDFCKIAEKVKQIHPDIIFTLIGKESEITSKDLEQYTSKKIINYLGFQKDVNSLIKQASILALPSYYREGLPRSILEAMAIGRPSIVYNNVGSKDVVFDGITGYIVDKGNINSFAEKIIFLKNNRDVVEKMSKEARKKVIATFDSNVINNVIYKTITNAN